jgi:uncharacterized protein (TIGR03000 family)
MSRIVVVFTVGIVAMAATPADAQGFRTVTSGGAQVTSTNSGFSPFGPLRNNRVACDEYGREVYDWNQSSWNTGTGDFRDFTFGSRFEATSAANRQVFVPLDGIPSLAASIYPLRSLEQPPARTVPPLRPKPLPLSAALIVHVPPDAEVFLQNQKMTSAGPLRRYDSPPLPEGKTFTYTVRAVWTVNNNKRVGQSLDVPVRMGDTPNIIFLYRDGRAEVRNLDQP